MYALSELRKYLKQKKIEEETKEGWYEGDYFDTNEDLEGYLVNGKTEINDLRELDELEKKEKRLRKKWLKTIQKINNKEEE